MISWRSSPTWGFDHRHPIRSIASITKRATVPTIAGGQPTPSSGKIAGLCSTRSVLGAKETAGASTSKSGAARFISVALRHSPRRGLSIGERCWNPPPPPKSPPPKRRPLASCRARENAPRLGWTVGCWTFSPMESSPADRHARCLKHQLRSHGGGALPAELPPHRRIVGRHRGDEGARVRVLRSREHLFGRPLFDDLAA